MSGDAAPFADAVDALAGPDPAAPPTPQPGATPPPSPAPQPVDPFADAKAALAAAPDPTPQQAPADAREQQLRTSVSQAQSQDPDAAAKLQQTSAQANVPVGAADQAMVDKINATKAVDYPQLIHDNPGVAQWLSDPKNAAVAHDDIPNLQHVDLAVRLLAKAAQPQGAPSVIGQDPEDDKEALPITTGAIGYGLHQALNEAGSTMLAIPALIQGAYRYVTGQDNPENFNFKEPGENTPEGMIWSAQQLITQQEQARASYHTNVAKDVLTGASGLAAQLPSMVAAPTAVAEHLAGQMPLMASRAMRAMAALKSMIATQATQSGGEGLEQSAIDRQKAGGGASIEPSDVANAVGQAALATVVGRAQGLVGPFAHFRGDPLTLGDIPRDLIANAMGTGTQAAGSQAIQSATSGNGLPQPGDIAKSYLSGAVMGTLLSLPNVPGAAALSKAHDLVQQTMLAQQARDNAVVLAQNHVASKLSATAQRAPDAMQALVANVIKHTGQPDTGRVLFQAEDWDEHWIHAGGGSKDLPRDMVTALTGDPNAYDMAKATGPGGNGTISVPLDAYQARISGTDHGAALLDKARLQPHGMTLVEANKFFKDAPQTLSSIGDEMKAEIAKQAASADPNGDAVRLEIAHNAVMAGQDPVNADAVARIHQDFHQTMANAMNEGRAEGEPRLTAADMAKAAPLDVRYAAPQAIPGRSVDAMDRDLNNIRAGKVHSNEEIFGKTLGDFLREHGGVRDDGGELKQMEVDANRGFRKKLSNPKGLLPDDAAQMAHDAGYLPERSIDSMLRAIDEEQHGKPTYTHANLNHDALANADHLKELHQFLKSIGADPVDEKDNAVIKQRIQEAEKDIPDAGKRYSQATGRIEAKGDSLEHDALKKQWKKANGDREPSNSDESWLKLLRDSAATDAANGKTFQQGGGKTVRGTFQPVGRGGILTFTPNANLSTFLHESAHYFFHVLSHLATQPGAPERLVKDHQAILDWLGVKDVKDLTDEHQEDIAKAMENYFMRGQAPKVELRGVFQRFKAWMKHVYGAIGPSTRNALSPEVHAVFDRMFASDAEIAAAQSRAGDSHALPRDAALFPVGPEGDADYERYRAAVDASQERAESNLRSELMRAYQQEATAKWNDERMDVHEKVANEINSRPVYNMIHMLQDGRMADGTRLPDDLQGLKLNQKELEKLYDPESLRALPGPARDKDKDGNLVAKANRGRPLYAKDGTLTLNDLAEQFGFSSGDEVFQALTGAPDRRTLIESETDARMREAHPDPLTDGSIATKADAALENEQKGKLLTMEVNALATAVNRGKKTGERDLVPSPLQVLRMAAEREVGNVPVGQLRPDLHRANEARAAKKAFGAAATSDHATAYHAKQSQMLNHELAMATEKAKVFATKVAEHARDLLRPAAQQRLGKAGGWEWTVTDRQGQKRTRFPTEAEAEAASKADPGSTFERTSSYVDQINGLLHTYEFANVSAKVLKRRADMAAFIQEQHDLDMPVDIPIEVQKQTTRINWKTLTVDQLGAMNDALRNIEAMAKLKNKFMDAQREGELQDTVAHLKNSILSSNKTRVLEPRGDSSFASITNRAGRIVNAYSRATDLCFRMDGHETGGAFFDEWERPFQDSADVRYRDTQEAVEHGNAMTDEWFKTADRGAFNRNLHKPQFFPTVKRSFTRLEVIRMAADYGSSGNRERLLANNKWTPEQAQSVFDSMPKADIAYLNAKIKQVNSYWPRIAALEQRTKGVAPKKVDGLPFQCKNGNVEGGYFRVIYDRVRNPGLMQKTGDEAAEAMMRGMGAGSAYTQHGHTIERTGNAGVPLSTDFGDFDRHIANVIHDLTHREVLIDAGRLLKRIAPTMTERYGDGVVPQFESQLRAIAAGGAQNTTVLDPLLGYLRQNTIAANRAFNVATSVRQLAGMPFVAARFGYLPAIRAVGNMLDPASVLYAHMNSPTLVRRNQERGRELNEVANRTGTFAFMHPLNASRYLFLNYAWKMLDTHGWFAAYHEAKGRFPDDEAKCMSIADGQLAATQGAVDLKDHSEIMRQGGELGKLLTSNMSWANANFSLMQLSMYKYLDKNGSWKPNNPKQMAQAIGAMSTLLVVAPAIYMASGQLMTQSDMSDWKKPAIVKDLAGEAAYTALSSVPLGRDLAPIFENHGGGAYQGPQGAAFLGTLAKAGYEAMSAFHGQSERRRSAGLSPGEKAGLDLSGIIFPIPSTQIEHMVAGYIAAQHQGEGAVGTTAATIFGPPDKQKRRLNQ